MYTKPNVQYQKEIASRSNSRCLVQVFSDPFHGDAQDDAEVLQVFAGDALGGQGFHQDASELLKVAAVDATGGVAVSHVLVPLLFFLYFTK